MNVDRNVYTRGHKRDLGIFLGGADREIGVLFDTQNVSPLKII